MCYENLYKSKPIYTYKIKIRRTDGIECMETLKQKGYNKWNAIAEAQRLFPAPVFSIVSVALVI